MTYSNGGRIVEYLWDIFPKEISEQLQDSCQKPHRSCGSMNKILCNVIQRTRV